MSSPYDVPVEYISPFVRGPLLTSGAGTDRSQLDAAASGTLEGGGIVWFVCLNSR